MSVDMAQSEVVVCGDSSLLSTQAADLIVGEACEAVRARGRFTLVLAGGSTPQATYRLLAEPQRCRQIDWDKIFIFFGDERFVPPTDDRSNYHMAHEALLSHVPIPRAHIYPISTDQPDPVSAALSYQRLLRDFFRSEASEPRFDMILLGMGDDGHTASLFPGAPALDAADRWVVASPPGTLPPPVERVTLTFPIINAARNVVFLVGGQKKAQPLAEVLQDHADPHRFPAAGVRPVPGKLTWLIDEAAASGLA